MPPAPAPLRRPRGGFTLTEALVAMSIFTVAAIATIEMLNQVRRMDSTGTAQDDLNRDGMSIIQQMEQDITSSGWYFPDPDYSNTYSGVSQTTDRTQLYWPYVQIQDTTGALNLGLGSSFLEHKRSTSLVNLGIDASVAKDLPGSATDATTQFLSGSPNAATVISAYKQWRSSFRARSQELIFLRATATAWDLENNKAITVAGRAPLLKFGSLSAPAWRAANNQDTLGILYTSGYKPKANSTSEFDARTFTTKINGVSTSVDASKYPYGVVMESGTLADPDVDISKIAINWERLSGAMYAKVPQTSGSAYNTYRDDLKEYSYVVLPSRAGVGRLVRCVLKTFATAPTLMNPSQQLWGEVGRCVSYDATTQRGMVVEKVLSDNVARVVFDTYRTVDAYDPATGAANSAVTSLDVNSIKVRLYMARASATGPRQVMTRIIETVLTMKTRNAAADRDVNVLGSAANRLGTPPIGISF